MLGISTARRQQESIDFAAHIGAVARKLLGDPNRRLSTSSELRYGTHGSLSIDIQKGTWYDHEHKTGGGVLDLIRYKTGRANGQAADWLRDELGLATAPKASVRQSTTRARQIVATYDYVSEHGELLFQVVRYEPKDFRQRRLAGRDWAWGLKAGTYERPRGGGEWRRVKERPRASYETCELPEVTAVPYHLAEVLGAGNRTIYIPEGEKDVEALRRLGLVATCNPEGAGNWPDHFRDYFAMADAVVLPDNDETGRDHARKVARNLLSAGATVRIVALPGLPEKGDVSDWIAAGGTAEQLHALVEQAPFWKPEPGQADTPPAMSRRGFTAASLDRQEFPPIRYIVPGYLPEGLTILAARPKMGKSWLALDWGAAIAFGGLAMGSVQCEPADVLYMALEDNWRRLQKRLRVLLGNGPKPERLLFCTEWPRLDQGGIEEIEAWADEAPNPRLVIVDTLAKIKPARDNRETQYEGDYRAMAGLHRLANDRGLAILGVHHDRKAEADDPFDTISGTLGLTGAADTILVMKRDTAGHVVLHGRGRDLEEIETAMRFEPERGLWTPLGSAAEVRRSDERNTILDALDDAGEPMSPADIAIATGMRAENVRFLLHKMMKAGEITKARYGRYAANTANTANTGGESE